MKYKISKDLIAYDDAILFMENKVNNIIKNNDSELVWLLEHPPIYSAGSSAKDDELLNSDRFPIYKTGRGGKYTYHGPGQLVAYIMLDLNKRNAKDLKKYIYNLEQVIINTLSHYGLNGQRRDDRIGVWLINNNIEKKIAAIGVRVRKWVTYHGIAINLDPNLEHFQSIIPCGISEYGVTSLKDYNIKFQKKDFYKIFQKEFEKIFL